MLQEDFFPDFVYVVFLKTFFIYSVEHLLEQHVARELM
jgi:hypothetical protein